MKNYHTFICKHLKSIQPLILLCTTFFVGSVSAQKSPGELILEQGWFIQSGQKVTSTGVILSSVGTDMSAWIPARVPSTVLGTLVDQGIYKDVYRGKNLEMIPRDQFQTSWWYRKEFNITDEQIHSNARIVFEGINYAANIWLNGVLIASADTTQGAFRVYDLDITKLLHKSGNAIAVQVFPPKPGDFTIGFVDWTPRPNDESMGIFRPVRINLSGNVSITKPFVQSRVNVETLDEAALTVSAMLINHTGTIQKTTVKVSWSDRVFGQSYN
jgi:exo-1,4-beta-D-glucosaminidase